MTDGLEPPPNFANPNITGINTMWSLLLSLARRTRSYDRDFIFAIRRDACARAGQPHSFDTRRILMRLRPRIVASRENKCLRHPLLLTERRVCLVPGQNSRDVFVEARGFCPTALLTPVIETITSSTGKERSVKGRRYVMLAH